LNIFKNIFAVEGRGMPLPSHRLLRLCLHGTFTLFWQFGAL